MKITEEQKKSRQVSIINQAFVLFCEKGVDNVSMKEIASASGVGVASVFRYFSTKAELLVATQKLYWNGIYGQLAPGDREGHDQKTGIQQIQDFLDAFFTLYQKHSDFILFSIQSRLYLKKAGVPMSLDDYDAMAQPVRTQFIHSLEKGRKDGTVKIQGCPESIFHTVWGIMRGFTDEIALWNACLDGKCPMEPYLSFTINSIIFLLGQPVDLEDMRDMRGVQTSPIRESLYDKERKLK